jgi:hypothetical protein
MQASCVTSCHSGTSPSAGLDLSGTIADVYDRIFNADPGNVSAMSKGYKLIYPNHPERSYLMHKIGSDGFDQDFSLGVSDGDLMPKSAPAWPDADIELIRQWILYGAKQSSIVADHAQLQEYYTGKGLPKIDRPAAPAPGEGIQIHHGPIFLNPGEELEVLRRFNAPITEDVEIHKLSVGMNEVSHHFILYRYDDAQTDFQGIEEVDGLLGLADLSIGSDQLGTWQFNLSHTLPEQTAYVWKSDQTLNLNYHVRNYNSDSVLAAEVFINIYTDEIGSTENEMYADLELFGGSFPFLLNVPNSGVPITLTMEQFDEGSTETWYIWLLQAHTHQLGIDYDIFKRNEDGSKGEQIYEGFFNEDYTFNQGFYDYSHPAVRKFEPFIEIKASEGLIHEATYLNSGLADVGFGLTTADEMFITYYHYTLTDPTVTTGLESILSDAKIKVLPNPFSNELIFDLDLTNLGEVVDLRAEIFDLSGRKVAEPFHQKNASGSQQIIWNSNDLAPGMYILKILNGTIPVSAQKILKSE